MKYFIRIDDLWMMTLRILSHILFWLTYMFLFVIMSMLFAPTSDLEYPTIQRISRFFFRELSFLPWKIIPFYFLFYFLVPRYFEKKAFWKMGLFFLGIVFLCLLGYRSMISPVNNFMYGETPSFNVYDLKRFMYSLIVDIIPTVGLASTVKLLKGQTAFMKKEALLKKEKLESELNFLRSQTNPHFLFNTLNNLYGLARNNDQNTAPSIMKLSNIMRYILYECSVPSIPIEKEVKIIEDYIELESLRYDDRLSVSFNKDVEDWNIEIAPLILLPFVENAYKHGVGETRFDAKIDIDLVLRQGELIFRITNSRDEDNVISSKGIGLKNVKRQLELIYGSNYDLVITPGSETFSVELSIQFQGNE